MELFKGQLDEGELEFHTLMPPFTVKCNHSPILKDSVESFVPNIIVEAAQVPAETLYKNTKDSVLRRGILCKLKLQSGFEIELQILNSGIFNGGLLYQFTLVDKEWKL